MRLDSDRILFNLLPSKGETLVQPLWVEDLVTCLVWALDNPETVNQTYEVGGSEYISLRKVVEAVMDVTRQRRLINKGFTPRRVRDSEIGRLSSLR